MVGRTLEHAVDEQLLLQVVHRLADIDLLHEPSVLAEDACDDLVELLIVGRIVVAHEGGIIIEDDTLVLEVAIIITEVLSQLRQLSLVLDIEGVEDAQLGVRANLPHYETVDVGVGIGADDQR